MQTDPPPSATHPMWRPSTQGPVEVPVQPATAETMNAPPREGWSPEVIESLASNLLPYVDRYLTLRENEQKHEVRISESEAKWSTLLTWSLLGFALLVIAGMTILTLYDKVSGDALLFLVGTTVGALFTMIHQQINARKEVAVVSDDS